MMEDIAKSIKGSNTGKMPRILFAAPGSGSGKTMITCGIIEALKRRKLKVASFKCGPDYIDPMFHRKVLGIPSGNLDTFFTNGDTTRYILWKKAVNADLTVIEGVMGFYDGFAGMSESASTYEVAKVTGTPVIMIVDGKGASVTLAAVIKGIIEYREDSNIHGIILNRVSAGYFERIKNVIERECGVKVLGFIPDISGISVPSRHLGLVAPEEIKEFHAWAGGIADVIEKNVDLDRLISIANEADYCEGKIPDFPRLDGKVKIAVARDEAFSFYYSENIELLTEMGAEIAEFSPLYDEKLPDDIDGLLFGGGYPENYAMQLENALCMRQSVKNACESGMPCIAECGGFMYLLQEIEDMDGTARKMTGVIEGKAYRTDKLCRFGYIEAVCRKNGVFNSGDMSDSYNMSIKGHEFHYWESTENGDGFMAKKPLSEKSYSCMVYTDTIAAGFPHFYYYSNPKMIYNFLQSCLSFQRKRK